MKKLGLILLVAVLLLVGSGAAGAATSFSDVAQADWYAPAVAFCQEQQLLEGTSATTFSPQLPMSRAMLATVLWRLAGSPSPQPAVGFTDLAANSWYREAVAWAAAQDVVSGYDDRTFGPTDPVTREQLATILYRYERAAAPQGQLGFSDAKQVGSWAREAVLWAQESQLMSGKPGNRFDPQGPATRAEVAGVLAGYVRWQQADQPRPLKGALVVYFSHSGTTRTVADYINRQVEGDLFQLVPVEPYPHDYQAILARSQAELAAQARPALANQVANLEHYQVVFVGYPIWLGTMPMAVASFLESADWHGKTIIPFCTSDNSGIEQSLSLLKELCPGATVREGLVANGPTNEIDSWLAGLTP